MEEGGKRTKNELKSYNNDIPIVSVITVVYNASDVLECTIQSVVEQTYENIEYIIIDGGSTDGSINIINKYSDKICYWRSEPDNGIYDAMNKGIDYASGDWVVFINAGDKFYCNETVEKIFFKKKSYEDMNFIYGYTILRWKDFDTTLFPSNNLEMPFCHQSCFTKLSLMKMFKFDTSYRICADRNFYHQLWINGYRASKYLDQPVSFFDCKDSFSTSNQVEIFKESAKIRNIIGIRYIIGLILIKIKVFLKSVFPKFTNLYRKRNKV